MIPAMIQGDDLTDIVGPDRVFDDPSVLRRHGRDDGFATPTTPRCVVQPATPEQVQAIVRWANRTATPLVPVSSGPPHFRGDSVPAEGGAVVVDLSTMNGILRIAPGTCVLWADAPTSLPWRAARNGRSTAAA